MSSPPESTYVEAAHYRLERWPGPGGTVLLHGLGADLGQMWGLTDGRVGDDVAAVLAPDARGHGGTYLPAGGLTFAQMAEDVWDLVDQVWPTGRCVFIGVSMGAATALRATLQRPGRVHALVLVRPAWLHEPESPNLRPVAQVGTLLRDLGPRAGREAFLSSSTYREVLSVSPSSANSLLGHFSAPGAQARAERLIEVPRSAPYSSPSDLAAIPVPTLVLGAPRDYSHPVLFAKVLAAGIPRAQLELLYPRDDDAARHHAEVQACIGLFVESLPPLH
jgi:pimeloyl-ACP methyl ester carboxylesterase